MALGEFPALQFGGTNAPTETFTYNNLLQLTRQVVPGGIDMQYLCTAGTNNGRIAQSIDGILGETVNYSYDALNRLTGAGATGGQWGQAYTFDGFGNLAAKTVTAGSATDWSSAVDGSTNRLVGQTYDANGNVYFNGTSYDVENKMVARTLAETSKMMTYQYDPTGHRVSAWTTDGVSWWNDGVTVIFYDITGKQVAVAGCGYLAGGMQCTPAVSNVYFGGRAISLEGQTVYTDRLGTVRWSGDGKTYAYLPYGEERTSTPDGRHKFGTYFRDSTLDGQDYAEQRYYNHNLA